MGGSIWVFIPTFLFVSLTPGLCMTLALTLGMTVGVRRTLWMMCGELFGVALVAIATVTGVAAIVVQYPEIGMVVKTLGGLYLYYIGIKMWLSKGKMALSDAQHGESQRSVISLITQGFVTAATNPKGWVFFIALLPPFINPQGELMSQTAVLLSIILTLEFICLMGYATGGRQLSVFLRQRGNVQTINRMAGSMMFAVGTWMVVG